MRILVTGVAGFIGFHLTKKLMQSADIELVVVDNINDYYDVQLKLDRLQTLGLDSSACQEWNTKVKHQNIIFYRIDISDKVTLESIFNTHNIDIVCHLAAQAGVRYSLINPDSYVQSNIVGFVNILEACRHHEIQHLVYASSSSVYGLNKKMPLSTADGVNHPVSLYAASKRSNELMAHTYSHLFNLPTTGLRFFTVYGPWGRPDMALFLFTKAIIEGKPIQVFNHGAMSRDFTYIDDIVEGILKVMNHPPNSNSHWDGLAPDPASSTAPFKVYNIGNNAPVPLLSFIETLEAELDLPAHKDYLPMQAGDVEQTYSDTSPLIEELDFLPQTSLKVGVKVFIDWYKDYYHVE